MTLKTLIAAGCISFAAATSAAAVTVEVNGVDWDVTTITATFDDSQTLLESQVFFRNRDLIFDFADEIGDALGSVFDPPFGARVGPLFVFDVITFSPLISGVAFFPDDGFSASFVHSPFAVSTFAVATPVAAVPLPAGGLLLLSALGGGAALKRRKKRAA